MLATLVLALVAGSSIPGGEPAAAAVPTGFEDRLVATVGLPTSLAFTPDGRLLIGTKAGTVHVYANGTLLPLAALDIRAKTCSNSERGLLGIAVDPAFGTNRSIFVYYTFNRFGDCLSTTANRPVNRVSRFTLSDTNVVDPASEVVLVDNMPSWNGNHNAGDLQFGKDGFLYVTVGDGGCDYAGDSGCAGLNDAARDHHVLLGKVLRITRTGGIPSTNPYLGSDSARCNVTGRTDAGKKCQETFAWGLRNPFRMAFHPDATGTRFYVNDVGQNAWEEVDLGQAAADYGWNVREGGCATGSTTNCGAPPAGMTNPIYSYAHTTGCRSITGGAFVPSGSWPTSYDGAYLYGDYVCGKLFRLVPVSGGGFTASEFATAPSVVHLAFGPHGATRALYYASFANGGEVRRIAYVGTANRTPIASASASPTSGPTPLTVAFDGRASSDADGDALTYEWSFGDGTTPATGATVSHTYQNAGTYTATLTVRDGRGGVDSATVRIDAGNRPPVPKIQSPAATKLFRVGEQISLAGSATDPEDGTLPSTALTWTVILHHDTHTHPFLGPVTGNNIPFTAPAPEDLAAAANSYLEIRLTATDSKGLKTTVSQALQPHKVNLTFDSQPSGWRLHAGELTFAAPKTVVSWHGYGVRVSAPTQIDGAGWVWSLGSWSDGGAPTHTIVTPSTATTYKAWFRLAPGAVFNDNFETGDLSRWSWFGGMRIATSPVYAGVYAGRATSTGSPAYATKRLTSPRQEVFYRFRFNLVSRAAGSPVTLARLRTDGGAGIVRLDVSSTGALVLGNEVSGTARTSSTQVASGWRRITLRVRINGSASHVEVWYDGTKVTALTGTESLGTTPAGRVVLGENAMNRAFDVAFDDLLVD